MIQRCRDTEKSLVLIFCDRVRLKQALLHVAQASRGSRVWRQRPHPTVALHGRSVTVRLTNQMPRNTLLS